MKPLIELIRNNIRNLAPYSTARDEYSGAIGIFLDANENPYSNGVNRYPDPHQSELKNKIASIKRVQPSQLFIGNGSDEAIDIIYRVFCNPGTDNVVAIAPTYGMYKVAANINDIQYREVSIKHGDVFRLEADKLLEATDQQTKVIFLCSPNNPSGNNLDHNEINKLLRSFQGIVVIDEAYIDFSTAGSYCKKLSEYPNLIVLQTLSKAWGVAGIRMGLAFASEEIIHFMSKVKYPYNINVLTQDAALEILKQEEDVREMIKLLQRERDELSIRINSFPFIEKVYPSDANFLLIKCFNPKKIYNFLLKKGIIVRDRSNVPGCESCLRISIGTPEENSALIKALLAYELLL